APLKLVCHGESGMKLRVARETSSGCLPTLRGGRVGPSSATQFGRFSPYFHRLPGWNSPEQAWAQTQGQLAWYRAMEEQGELVSVRNRQDLDGHLDLWLRSPGDDGAAYVVESRKSAGKLPISYVLSLEGADWLVTLGHLERSYQDGLRALGPAHYGPGRYAHGTDAEGPLPPQGRELLKEMRRLGIILDVTHLCDECFWDALDVYDGPL